MASPYNGMIDSHAHIDAKAFDADRPDMLQRAWDAGIEAIIVPDIEPSRRPHLQQVVDSDPRLFRGIGIHPHHAGSVTEADLQAVEAGADAPGVVAIGEIGLDYHYDFCPPEVQQHVFREHIRIAKRKNLPIIVHNRESDEDVLRILTEEQDGTLRGVLHCFSSDATVLQRALDLGMIVSFTGNITFKNSTLLPVVESVPDDAYMIETDSPYIAPVPHRGTRNEPAHVALVAQKIAEIKSMAYHDILQATTTTAKRFFGLTALMIALVMALMTSAAIAQPTPPRDEDYENDYDWEIALENYFADSTAYERWVRPRRTSIGLGISIGSNTQVESQTFRQRYDNSYEVNGNLDRGEPRRWTFFDPEQGPNRSFSFEGLTAIGGTITYSPFTSLMLEGTFTYSQNTGPAEDFGLDPITTNIVEVTGLYNLNPYSRVNFWPQFGGTMALVDDGTSQQTKFGINFGLGIGVNVPTSIGLFYPMFNVRFNAMLQQDQNKLVQRYLDENGTVATKSDDPTKISVDLADVNVLYSIPRFTILYYPPF